MGRTGSTASPVEAYVNLENHLGAGSNAEGWRLFSPYVNRLLKLQAATPDNSALVTAVTLRGPEFKTGVLR